jgi:hypothetical protein
MKDEYNFDDQVDQMTIKLFKYQDGLDKVFIEFIDARTTNTQEEIDFFISKTVNSIWNSDSGSEAVMHIVCNIAAYLLGYKDKDQTYDNRHYSPFYRNLLFRFLERLYNRRNAIVLTQIVDSHLNVHNSVKLDDTDDFDPIESGINSNFKLGNQKDKIDFISFVRHMKKYEFAFEQYTNFWKEPAILGNGDENRHFSHEKSHMFKYMILQLSIDLLKANKKENTALFECLTPKVQNGKHIVVAVSGFLSEDDDNSQAWKALYENYPDLPIYSYRWKSEKMMSLIKPFASYKSLASFMVKKSMQLLSLVQQGSELIGAYQKMFTDSMKNAKCAGRILAHSLMIQFPFRNQSISLIGFSLGTQVIKSWLKELHRFKANNISKSFLSSIVNNVYFLGGAVNSSNHKTWSNILSVVRGEVVNGYCKSDYILYLYKCTVFKTPLGLCPLLEMKEKHEEEKISKSGKKDEKPSNFELQTILNKIRNWDVTVEAYGHLFYRGNLKQILEKIEFSG